MLTSPFALLGLLSVPALLAVYLLRNRVKHRPVSSLMLWVERSRMTHGGARLQRNRLPLLFFLELLILLLLVWAAAGPRMLSKRGARPLTIVLDNSASMGALGRDGLSAAQRGQKLLLKRIRNDGFTPVQVVLAGQEPRWVDGEDVETLLQGKDIDAWNLSEAAFDVQKALLLARAGGHPNARLLVVSDARPELSPEGGRLRWLSVGQSLPNAGFVNAVRSGDRCMVELLGAGTVQMSLTLGAQSTTVPVDLEQGIPRRLTYRLDDPAAHFEAALPNDALMIDNRIRLLPEPQRRVRVRQAVRHPALRELVARAVEATGMLADPSAPYELLITDSAATVTNAETWVLQLQAAQEALPFTGPFVVDHASPLMEGVSFEGLAWAGSTNSALPGLPMVMAGNTPLLSRMDDLAGRPRFYMQLDPELSTLQFSPAWPSLFWNLMRARAAEQPGFREVNLRPGMTPEFVGTATLPELILPKLVEVEAEGKTFRAAYNFLDAGESDLTDRNAGDDGDWLEPESVERHYADLTPLAILAALALLALHQLMLRRESQLAG